MIDFSNPADQMIVNSFWGHPKYDELMEVYYQMRAILLPLPALHHTRRIVNPPSIPQFFEIMRVSNQPSFNTWRWN